MDKDKFLKIRKIFIVAGMFFFFSLPQARGEVYTVDPVLSTIGGSIHYTVLGKYSARFQDYSGTLKFDFSRVSESSVVLNIKTDSVKSRWPALDRIVRSKQILDVEKYPRIIFHSTAITKCQKEYTVTGNLEMHGVTKKISFPFTVEGPYRCHSDQKYVIARGTWMINRKEFGIVWNKFLDHGGILVGNHITVDWEIIAFSP